MQTIFPISSYQIDRVCEINFVRNVIEIHVHDGLIDLGEVQKIIDKLNELHPARLSRILIHCDNNATISLKALVKLMKTEFFKYAYAKAYIITSVHQRMMAAAFALFVNRKSPVKFFRSRHEGMFWLQRVIIY